MIPVAQAPVIVGAAAFGLVFGSFVTALSYRLPRNIGIADGRSRCGACGHVLAARDLIPVFSWVGHGGKCSYCKGRISPRYPAIELISTALFVGAAVLLRDPVKLALLLALTPILLTLAVIDLEWRQLPNILLALLVPLLLIWRWRDDGNTASGIAVAAIVFLIAIAVNAVVHRVAPESRPLLGGGDGKLLALAALALPLPPYFLFLAIAGSVGLILGLIWQWRRGEVRFPFGPAIVLALWLVLAGELRLPFLHV